MASKYVINEAIMRHLDEAMVRANILHNDLTLPSDSIAYRQQTYALQQALSEAIAKIRRY